MGEDQVLDMGFAITQEELEFFGGGEACALLREGAKLLTPRAVGRFACFDHGVARLA